MFSCGCIPEHHSLTDEKCFICGWFVIFPLLAVSLNLVFKSWSHHSLEDSLTAFAKCFAVMVSYNVLKIYHTTEVGRNSKYSCLCQDIFKIFQPLIDYFFQAIDKVGFGHLSHLQMGKGIHKKTSQVQEST